MATHELDQQKMGNAAHWTPENLIGNMSLKELLFSNDYRAIALKGIFTSIIMLAVGGFFALVFRSELTFPGVVLVRNAFSGTGGWTKTPLMAWAAGTVGLLFIASTLPLGFVGYGLLSDWGQWTDVAYFDPSRGGSVKFFLYMFWTYGHPAVYLPFVPAIAVIFTIMPRLLGNPMWSYWSGVVAFILLAIGAMPIGPHHFQPLYTVSGDYQRFVQILTMLVFIPSVLHVFNWIATLFMNPIPDSARRAIPFKFMVMAIAFIVYGGATAFLNAQIAPDSDFIHNPTGSRRISTPCSSALSARWRWRGFTIFIRISPDACTIRPWPTRISGCGRSACLSKSPPWVLRDTSTSRAGFMITLKCRSGLRLSFSLPSAALWLASASSSLPSIWRGVRVMANRRMMIRGRWSTMTNNRLPPLYQQNRGIVL